MKRNIELIKIIMLNVEAENIGSKIDGYTEQEVLFHQKLLIDADFLQGKVHISLERSRGEVDFVVIQEITWQGYDFLELLKDDKKFEYIKDISKKMPLEVIKVGIKLAFDKLKEI